MDVFSKKTDLPANKIKNIFMEYYSELYKRNQYQTLKLIYELMFGKTKTSYKMIEQMFEESGFTLKTTESEWFKILFLRALNDF